MRPVPDLGLSLAKRAAVVVCLRQVVPHHVAVVVETATARVVRRVRASPWGASAARVVPCSSGEVQRAAATPRPAVHRQARPPGDAKSQAAKRPCVMLDVMRMSSLV